MGIAVSTAERTRLAAGQVNLEGYSRRGVRKAASVSVAFSDALATHHRASLPSLPSRSRHHLAEGAASIQRGGRSIATALGEFGATTYWACLERSR